MLLLALGNGNFLNDVEMNHAPIDNLQPAEFRPPVPADPPRENRREHTRRDCEICIIATPVDEAGNEIGSLVAGHCINVSEGGIRITLATALDSKFLRIEPVLDEPALGFSSAVFEVARHSSEYWCTTYAGPFINARSGQRQDGRR